MKPLFLIGFMGSGKTTLARALSQRTSLEMIDLDTYIERRFHRNVRDIFTTDGEARFRDIEARMLREAGEFEDVIVACGGGTPCHDDNIDFMLEHGTTVLLEASEERLLDRLRKGRRKRPLIASLTDDEILASIRSRSAERMPYYSRAPHTFNTDRLENAAEIDATANEFIQRFNLPLK